MTRTAIEDPAPAVVADWLGRRAARAGQAGHRALIVLAGPRQWGHACAQAWLSGQSGEPVLWVSDSAPEDAWSVAGPKAHQLLGQETAHVIFDAYAGFNPDAFGAVVGTVRAGGLVVVLAPALREWPGYADPEYSRIAVAPWSAEQIEGRFLARLVRRLRASADADCIEAGCALPPLPEPAAEVNHGPPATGQYRTSDQEAAVAAVERVAEGRARRPVALIADRGRGKSAALGLAAAHLLEKGYQRIVVTAPTRRAVAPLFAHAAERLGNACRSEDDIALGDATIAFAPPDELARQVRAADLVLVDEAAALPGPLLEELLRAYPRIAFATTLHGYEGSGSGFALRFEPVLDRVTPHWRRLTLKQPIRWQPGDPVEAFAFDALLLDAEPAPPAHEPQSHAASSVIERVERDALAADEGTLRQVFGLLRTAHYRTTPGDLRNLLDGPNCQVWLARQGTAVIGACLTADEGLFDQQMADAVARGERRIRGHLLPQMLAFHAFQPEAAAFAGRRIMRIAVHPERQGDGIGSALLEHVRAMAQRESFDYWGAAFGATPALVRFWARAGLLPVRLGITREASSGHYSAVMVGGLSSEGEKLTRKAHARFAGELPLRLPEFFSDLVPELVQSLLQATDDAPLVPPLEQEERSALTAFVHGQQPYENVAIPVWKAALALLAHEHPGRAQDVDATAALVAKVLQKKSWAAAARAGGYKGQREVRAALRQVLLQSESETRSTM